MKKLISTIAVAGLLMSSAAHAGINPKNIDESSSRVNILKVINEKIAEGKTGGVIGMFAWTSINGEVYSASLAEIRRNARGGNYTKAFSEIIQQDVLEDVKIANQQELQDAIMALYSGNSGPSELEIAQQRIAFLQARGNLLKALIDLDHDEHADHIAGLKKAVAEAHGAYLQSAADYVAEQVELGRDENGEAAAASISKLTGVTATYDADTNTISVDTSELEATVREAGRVAGVASVTITHTYDNTDYEIVTEGSINTANVQSLIRSAEANGVASVNLGYTYGDTTYNIVEAGDIDHAEIEAMEDAMFLDGFLSGVASVNGDDITVTTPTGISYTGSSSAKTGVVSVDSGHGIVSTTAPTGVEIEKTIDAAGSLTFADGSLSLTRVTGLHTTTWTITGSGSNIQVLANGSVQASGTAEDIKTWIDSGDGLGIEDFVYTATTYVAGNYTVRLSADYGDVATASTNLAAVTGINAVTIAQNGNVIITFDNHHMVKSGALVALDYASKANAYADGSLNGSKYRVVMEISGGNFVIKSSATLAANNNLNFEYDKSDDNDATYSGTTLTVDGVGYDLSGNIDIADLTGDINDAIGKAYNEGYDEGYEDGFKDGYNAGWADARDTNGG